MRAPRRARPRAGRPPRAAPRPAARRRGRRLAEAEDRDDDVLGVELEVEAVVVEGGLWPAGSRSSRCRARRSIGAAGPSRRSRPARPCASSSTARPGIAAIASRVAAIAASVSPSSSSPWTQARRRAASSEPESSALGLVVSTRLTQRSTTAASIRPPAPEVQHRRLGQAADDLVGRGDDEVGAAGERVWRQLGVEVQVGAPGLVDDQRHAALVGDLGQPGDVGAGAEVGRRDDHRPDRARRRRPAPSPATSGVRQWAMPSSGSSSGATKVGRIPLRTRPSITEEWTLRWTTTGSPPWASARQVVWLPCEAPLIRNQVRRASQAPAASRCACWNGVGSGPMSTPSVIEGMSLRRPASPTSSRIAGSAPIAALVPRHLEATGVAGRVGEQRVDVGSRRLGRSSAMRRVYAAVFALTAGINRRAAGERRFGDTWGAMKHTPHGYWLEEAGTRSSPRRRWPASATPTSSWSAAATRGCGPPGT